MDTPLRILALALAGVVLTLAATPCPPNPEAHHASATDASSELSVKAKCPCSCSDGPASRLSTTHLDFAVERDAAESPLAFVWQAPASRGDRLPAAPQAPLEAVPI